MSSDPSATGSTQGPMSPPAAAANSVDAAIQLAQSQDLHARKVAPDTNADTLALERQCDAVFSWLGWHGPLSVQCQGDARGCLRIHEFNARHSAASAERCMLGYVEVPLGIGWFSGVALTPTQWATSPARREVARMSRRAVDPTDVEALQERGGWSPDDVHGGAARRIGLGISPDFFTLR